MRALGLISISIALAACAPVADAPRTAATPAPTAPESKAPPRRMSLIAEPRLCDDYHEDSSVVAAAQARCDANDGDGCRELGRPYWCGQGVAMDRGRAVAVVTRACDLGLVDACGAAGLLEVLRGPDGDRAHARSLLGRACERGEESSCENLAFLDLMEGTTTTDVVPILERMCAKGRMVSCGNLAQLLAIGERTPRDLARARKLGVPACDKGSPAGCNAVGLVAANDTPRDDALAVRMFTQACTQGAPAACDNLGLAYLKGIGVPVDAAEAARLFQKACDGGHARACTELGKMRASTQGN